MGAYASGKPGLCRKWFTHLFNEHSLLPASRHLAWNWMKRRKWSLSQCHRKEMIVIQLAHCTIKARRSKSRYSALKCQREGPLTHYRWTEGGPKQSQRWCCSWILKEIKASEKLVEAEAHGRWCSSNRNSKYYPVETSVTKTRQKIAWRTLPLVHFLCASGAVQLLYATRLLSMRTVCQPEIWSNSYFLEAQDMPYIF